ncbi:ndufs4 NADH dehydrogenase Fe-S protein subunit [Malassezia brasiliensis]|uniref:NADH dehydrogenase [ubiquinone] iron-sulfur protein 4, mitochondrial n=1 Tax=Malassezia brasiliensis TaxID=1821822 RepID=A0AAF0DUK3_9BASI|nr:ndufs4 NADH dehydrogenase Fe-S protein subunit [Malassezia brasiliensis]
MPILPTVVRRSVTAARPSLARSLQVSARNMKEDNGNYMAGVPIPRTGERSTRDLVREQVDRESEPTPVSILGDAPNSLHQRVVRIYQPAKPATMSGRAGTKHWRVDFDVLQGSGRWESPLMGWASTADSQQALYMKFDTKEDAVFFCQKQGWDFFIQEPHKAHIPPKQYANNYKHVPGKLRIHHTK